MTAIHWLTPISGNFDTASDWSGGVVPGAGDDAIINAGGTTPYTVSTSGNKNITVNSIQTGANATLEMSGGGTYTAVAGTGVGVNAGAIAVGGDATFQLGGAVTNVGLIDMQATLIVAAGGVTLKGAGEVILDDLTKFPQGVREPTLTNVDNTITGDGYVKLAMVNEAKGVVDAYGPYAMTLNSGVYYNTIANAGLIESTGAGGLVLKGSVANTGQIRDTGAGALTLFNDTVNDTKGGTLSGAHIILENGIVLGGALTNAAGDTIVVDAGDTGALKTASLLNQGAIVDQAGGVLTLFQSVDNTGSIDIDGGAGAITSLQIGYLGATLTGAGTITLSNSVNNQIIGPFTGPGILTNVDNTISGAGYIGFGGLELINQTKGVIDATGTAALTIGVGNGLTNAGTIEATGAGGLVFEHTTVNNAGGVISAAPGSSVTVQGISLVEGGSLKIAAGAALDIDIDSIIDIDDHSSVILGGAVVNAGTINLETGTLAATLQIGSNTTLSGGGAVVLGSGTLNRIFGTSATTILTNLGDTVVGAGRLGLGKLTLVNGATGVVEAAGGTLVLNTSGETVDNSGLLEAAANSHLDLQATTVDDAGGGVLMAAAGSTVDLQGATVIGGVLQSSGNGQIRTYAGANLIDGTTSSVANQGLVVVSNNTSLTAQESLDNSGKIVVDAASNLTSLTVGSKGLTLSGGGQIVLSNNADNRISAVTVSTVLTNVDNRITGAGQIAGTMALINQAKGVIDATGTNALILDTGTIHITNAGTIEAAGTGGATIVSVVNNTGVLEAAGGTLTVEGAVGGAGSAVIAAGAVDFTSTFNQAVDFTRGVGMLELAHGQAYKAAVTGFSKTGGTSLDLDDIAFESAGEATFSGTAAGGVLTVTDGTHTARIRLVGDYLGSTFTAAGDGHGGTMIIDPTAPPPAAHAFAAAMAGLGAATGVTIGPSTDAHRPAPLTLLAGRIT